MIWNRYSLRLFIYLCILSILGFGFVWSVYSNQLIITNTVMLSIFFIAFFMLLRYLNKTNKDLNHFIKSIQYLDNLPIELNTDFSHKQLLLTYRKIVDQIKDSLISKESEHQYFKYVLEQIGIGIISCDKNGKIEIYNKAAKELFGIENPGNINMLNKIKADLAGELIDMKSGTTNLISFNGKVENLKILVRAVDLKVEEKSLRLLSFQNIKTQLEQSELEAWQKLIRVLTHEIMNSVTPIKSLTYSMQKSLLNDKTQNKDQILKGLNAIENRSKGLLEFVESYKNLTQIPKPNYERIQIGKLFSEIQQLLKKQIESENILFTTGVDTKDLSIIVDGKLLTQVLINLIQNSVYALENLTNKKINLNAEVTIDGKTQLTVFDNGKGISEEIIDKIFVPFYSTRPNGSGIGLSFARQVMVIHNGTIEVKSKLGEFTLFIITI